MLEKHLEVMECSLDNTLLNLTTYCLKHTVNSLENTVAGICYLAGRTRLDMGFVQQEDVAFAWLDTLNTQGLVCTFKLSHHLLLQIGNPSLNLQRLKWHLIIPVHSKDYLNEASDTQLLDSAVFHRITKQFDDSVVDTIEAAIVEMSS